MHMTPYHMGRLRQGEDVTLPPDYYKVTERRGDGTHISVMLTFIGKDLPSKKD